MPDELELHDLVKQEAKKWKQQHAGKLVQADSEALKTTQPLSILMAGKITALRQWAENRTVSVD